MSDHRHHLVFGVVQAGDRVDPHIECVTAHRAGVVCQFNEYVASEGHSEALYSLRWPPAFRGHDLPVQFPLVVVERRDEEAPDEPTWEFEIVGVIR